MYGLKEWATVVNALENGDQVILLRKGGILETDSGFKIESKKFLLFPTFEHQESAHIKPQFQNHLLKVNEEIPKEGYSNISSYAEVIYSVEIGSEKKIRALSNFHIFSETYIEERIRWLPEKPMNVLFLKIFKIPQFEIPIISDFQGCKSWIDINEDISSGEPVLDTQLLESKLTQFREIVN